MYNHTYTYTYRYLGGLIIEDTNLTTFSHGTYTMMDSEICGWAPSFPNMQPALFRITALHWTSPASSALTKLPLHLSPAAFFVGSPNKDHVEEIMNMKIYYLRVNECNYA